MSERRRRLLVVEDQQLIAADLGSTLRRLGYDVVGSAPTGSEAVAAAGRLGPELVLMDIRLRGEMDGIEAASIIRERFDLPVVFLTAYADEATIGRAKLAAPFGYIVKPFNERELRAAIEVALHKHETDRLLESGFIAMLSHELRNPLAAIRSATELLQLRGCDDDEQERTYAILERQSAHLAKLIDGLLDVSRIVSGRLTIEREPVDLRHLLRETVDDRAGQLAARGLELRVDLARCPRWVCGDRVRLVQVFDNLLSNAARFTDRRGTVEIVAEQHGGEAVVQVRDTGSGIDAALLPHVFEPFSQADQSLARAAGGLGLGLAVVKGVVELHGGAVDADSRGQGQGATITVRLPVSDDPPSEIAAPHAHAGAARVLVVEDNEDAADTLRLLLEAVGHEVAIAHDGSSALERARAFAPDVVLCDIGLPGGMNGYDVARALRATADPRGTLLVAVTGYGRPEDVQRASAAGFDAHLTKPVDLAAIDGLLRGHRAAPP